MQYSLKMIIIIVIFQKKAITNRKIIFEQPFCDNFYDNFFSHSHIIFSFSPSIALVFVPRPTLFCIF